MFGTNRALRGCTLSIALFTIQALAQAGDVLVDAGASGDGSGSSWANAFVQLQDGLAAAQSGDTIFVAGGVYLPDRSAGQPTGTGDRFASFRIEQSLAVLGGFAGSADPGDPDKHNPFEFTTVLSGDLAQDDGGLFDPNTVNPSKPEFQDNSAHVVIVTTSPGSAGGFVSVSLRDLVIQGGFARQDPAAPGSPDPMTGAGLLCYEANTATGLLVTLDKCTLQGNFAMESGGGIASKGNGIVMRSCRVVGNASRYGAGYVGLVQETDDSHAHLTAVRTLWAFNHVRLVSPGTPAGGGLALDRAIVDARNCVFFSNSASTGNTTGRGGAIYVRGGSVLRAHNNTFRENRNFSGTAGATLYCEDVLGGLEFANNICWGAIPVSAHMRYPVDQSSIRRFGSNDIEDKGNNLPDDPAPGFDIDADPQFFNALGRLSSSSPCIDAGRNQGVPEDAGAIMELDSEGTTRILDHAVSGATGFGGPPGWDSESTQGQRPIVDIGAFEFVFDCNGNGIPDDEDILSGLSDDCDGNGVPDECQPDCNKNGIADPCDVASGFSEDCNENLVPDECEPDCNNNGQVDECDILQGISEDCNANIIPDECEFPEGDQNNNGVLDDCEIPCVEFDRTRALTGRDTITILTNTDNPELEAGYVYVHTLDREHKAIAFDHLIGQLLIVDGIDSFDYSVNAVDFRAGMKIRERTDVDGDDHLDLNGVEYEMAPNELLVPRFWGQADPMSGVGVTSELVLIGLSGGSQFRTTVDFEVYNDNEEAFSAQHTFECWEKLSLGAVSGVFSTEFLRNFTNHDPNEVYGNTSLETGWFRMKGRVANSGIGQVLDPAVYAVLVEHSGGMSIADLPFEVGSRAGHLLPGHGLGDNEEWGGTNSYDPDANLRRRQPGSLLLYPEFDNRNGVVSVLTVTNTSHEEVNVHFVYIGRWKQF